MVRPEPCGAYCSNALGYGSRTLQNTCLEPSCTTSTVAAGMWLRTGKNRAPRRKHAMLAHSVRCCHSVPVTCRPCMLRHAPPPTQGHPCPAAVPESLATPTLPSPQPPSLLPHPFHPTPHPIPTATFSLTPASSQIPAAHVHWFVEIHRHMLSKQALCCSLALLPTCPPPQPSSLRCSP